MRKVCTATLVAIFLSTSAASAQDRLPTDNGLATYHTAPDYRASQEHPLRIIGYVLHPIGWLLREGITRPLSYFTSSSAFNRSFFGHREHDDWKGGLCFSDTGVPDCHSVAPYNKLGKNSEETVAGMNDSMYFPDVAFDFNKDSLTDLGEGRVRQIAKMLSENPDMVVTLNGHADYKGTDEYNQELGSKRADRVRGELINLGIDPNRLAMVSSGEGEPIFTEDTNWATAVNRRVSVVIGQ